MKRQNKKTPCTYISYKAAILQTSLPLTLIGAQKLNRQMPEAESSPSLQNAKPCIDPADHLPLSILRSECIPSAPSRSTSTIDWLPDFAGYSWVAYGASSLLVISHFPSPLSQEEAIIGPIFRQVFALSNNSSPVTSVSWSSVTPSIGELAAASENFICIFAHDSANSKGIFKCFEDC